MKSFKNLKEVLFWAPNMYLFSIFLLTERKMVALESSQVILSPQTQVVVSSIARQALVRMITNYVLNKNLSRLTILHFHLMREASLQNRCLHMKEFM